MRRKTYKIKKQKKLISLRAIQDYNSDYKPKKCYVCHRKINKRSHCIYLGIDKNGTYVKQGKELYRHKRQTCAPGGKYYMKDKALAKLYKRLFQ